MVGEHNARDYDGKNFKNATFAPIYDGHYDICLPRYFVVVSKPVARRDDNAGGKFNSNSDRGDDRRIRRLAWIGEDK
tara:strand:+ start:2716 stop:2946 length:231 start_codon:yes stop_codon:yes gene_type:complete